MFKKFGLKTIGEYHDLYVQNDTLLFADVFENFRNKCIEIYEFDPAHVLSEPGFSSLKRTGIRLQLFTDNDMLLMIEKEIRIRIVHEIHRYAKANNKYMKNYNKTLNHYILCI